MKQTWEPSKQAFIRSDYGKTNFDNLPLPNGRKVSACSNSELANLFIGLGVEGVSHANGRAANLEHYSRHLDAVQKKAADAAVQQMLKGASQ